MLDNIDIAILTKVNALAVRHGLKPYDFVAVYRTQEVKSTGVTEWVLDFELPASGNALREDRYNAMLASLGVAHGNDPVLVGSVEKIIDALDNALQLASRPHGRF
jgi:hypothetical protein